MMSLNFVKRKLNLLEPKTVVNKLYIKGNMSKKPNRVAASVEQKPKLFLHNENNFTAHYNINFIFKIKEPKS